MTIIIHSTFVIYLDGSTTPSSSEETAGTTSLPVTDGSTTEECTETTTSGTQQTPGN